MASHLKARQVSFLGSQVQGRNAVVGSGIHVGIPFDEKLHSESEIVFFFSSTKRKEIQKNPPPLHNSHIHCMTQHGEHSTQVDQTCLRPRWLLTIVLCTPRILDTRPKTEQSFHSYQHHKHPLLSQSVVSPMGQHFLLWHRLEQRTFRKSPSLILFFFL